MNLLFVDCETTGKPVNYKASYKDVDNWPRVISLAWILTDPGGAVLNTQHHLIKPDGWKIPREDFWIQNGFFQETSEQKGRPIKDVLGEFAADKVKADVHKLSELNLFKKDKHNHYTLHRGHIRRLHGRSWIKQYYKTLNKKSHE